MIHSLEPTLQLKSLGRRDSEGKAAELVDCPQLNLPGGLVGTSTVRASCDGEADGIVERELRYPLQVDSRSGPWDFMQTMSVFVLPLFAMCRLTLPLSTAHSRIPSHEAVTPTTLPRTSSPVVHSYMWCLDVVYSVGARPRRVLTIKKPIRLTRYAGLLSTGRKEL